MAYISTDTVKGIRNEIKKQFPTKEGWKFSVTCQNYSQVTVSLMQSPLNFLDHTDRDHLQMVQYSKDSFPPEQKEVISTLENIALTEDYFDHSDSQTDYFHCSHYIDIEIGKWNREFKVSA